MTVRDVISLNLLYRLTKPVLMSLDAERAHDLTLSFLQMSGRIGSRPQHHDGAHLNVAGLQFPNRVGLAAGFDKNGTAIVGATQMGFGHIEIGGVTPRPQRGNSKPRLFRLVKERAVINRMGFNNDGMAVIRQNLESSPSIAPVVLGINLGKNADTPILETGEDFKRCMTELHEFADYFTLNVSSPNTARLRELQDRATLDSLLKDVLEHRDQLLTHRERPLPVFVKISPDLDPVVVREIAMLIQANGCDGIVASNTTLSRDGIRDRRANESGGLSGLPLFQRTLRSVEILRHAIDDSMAIVAVGGIGSADNANACLQAGADLLQIYTGLIYRGPQLVQQIVQATS